MKVSTRSILRWAGGKRRVITKLLDYLPIDILKRTYYEPFFGAGSMYFAIHPQKAMISDFNCSIMKCFKWIKNDWKSVSKHLSVLVNKNNENDYYDIRAMYNRSNFTSAQAARFIYLNHTSYNGIFRVNKKGEYNVPFGNRKSPQFPSITDLKIISDKLSNALLVESDYEKALQFVKKGDFVYLDPPYPPLNGTSYFTHYTQDRFNIPEQIRLSKAVNIISEKGCLFMMTNADIPLIRKLYKSYRLHDISVTRYITCKKNRHKVSELVITNYDTHM